MTLAAAIDRNACGWLDVLARQPRVERHDGWVITDVPFSLCNSVVMPFSHTGNAPCRMGISSRRRIATAGSATAPARSRAP